MGKRTIKMQPEEIEGIYGEMFRGLLSANMQTIKRYQKKTEDILAKVDAINPRLEQDAGNYSAMIKYRNTTQDLVVNIRNTMGLFEDIRKNTLSIQKIFSVITGKSVDVKEDDADEDSK